VEEQAVSQMKKNLQTAAQAAPDSAKDPQKILSYFAALIVFPAPTIAIVISLRRGTVGKLGMSITIAPDAVFKPR
jgi:hypothetical protein